MSKAFTASSHGPPVGPTTARVHSRYVRLDTVTVHAGAGPKESGVAVKPTVVRATCLLGGGLEVGACQVIQRGLALWVFLDA